MNETLFQAVNLGVLPFWALMIFAPTWRWTQRILRSLWVLVPFPTLYAILVVPKLHEVAGALARPDLNTIAALLGNPEATGVAWIHFVAFDLFVGRWIYLDSRERETPTLAVGPILFLTLMLGPLGLLVYLALRPVLKTTPDATDRATQTA